MQLDELIPNITLFFFQSVIGMPKTGFPTKNHGFWKICKIA